MYFSKEDSWMNPDLHIARLEAIETNFIEQLEHIQDPKVIIEYQKRLNNLLVSKMEWIKLKERLVNGL